MFIGNKKCRIYAACGVSQTPKNYIYKREGIFNIKLENEYAFIARALEKKVDENGEKMYSKSMIYDWLDKIRKMGLNQSFLTVNDDANDKLP